MLKFYPRTYATVPEYINIPINVIGIGDNPFAGCTNLHQVDMQNQYFDKEKTLLFNKEHTRLIACLPPQYIGSNLWTLINFGKLYGTKKVQRGEFYNNKTNDTFHALIFTNTKEEKTYVCFSKKLGELSVQEIVENKNKLYVMKSSNGIFILCEKKQVFYYPDKLLKLKHGLETIDNNAFYNDTYLEEITLPETLERMALVKTSVERYRAT